ncbi:MAG: hypothetical protein EOM37_06345 [Proteobacteria bacterium]|nr:hypothetical protein [Alphaproteobacteria bacterium]NCC03650.1 hypothetical protein [Pseudomonadota bacterium]
MITSVALHRIIDFLPTVDLGKLWSRLRVIEPVRPNSAEQSAVRIAWIREYGDNLPEGVVHRVPDGRLFYTAIEEGTGRLEVERAQLLTAPLPELTQGEDVCPPRLLGPKGKTADRGVQALLVKSFYGKKAPTVLASLSLI